MRLERYSQAGGNDAETAFQGGSVIPVRADGNIGRLTALLQSLGACNISIIPTLSFGAWKHQCHGQANRTKFLILLSTPVPQRPFAHPYPPD